MCGRWKTNAIFHFPLSPFQPRTGERTTVKTTRSILFFKSSPFHILLYSFPDIAPHYTFCAATRRDERSILFFITSRFHVLLLLSWHRPTLHFCKAAKKTREKSAMWVDVRKIAWPDKFKSLLAEKRFKNSSLLFPPSPQEEIDTEFIHHFQGFPHCAQQCLIPVTKIGLPKLLILSVSLSWY